MRRLDTNHHRLPLDVLMTPSNGAKAIVDGWWVVAEMDGKEWVFGYRAGKYGPTQARMFADYSPQYNHCKEVANMVCPEKCYVKYVPVAFWSSREDKFERLVADHLVEVYTDGIGA